MGIRRRSTGKGKVRGAGLVEVVVAIGVLSVSMAILTQLVMAAMQASALAHRQVTGVLLAQERMEEIIANRADLDAWKVSVPLRFDYDLAHSTYHFLVKEPGDSRERTEREDFRWGYTISDVEGRDGLKEAQVHVHWLLAGMKGFRGSYRLRALVAVPGGGAGGAEPPVPPERGAEPPGDALPDEPEEAGEETAI